MLITYAHVPKEAFPDTKIKSRMERDKTQNNELKEQQSDVLCTNNDDNDLCALFFFSEVEGMFCA